MRHYAPATHGTETYYGETQFFAGVQRRSLYGIYAGSACLTSPYLRPTAKTQTPNTKMARFIFYLLIIPAAISASKISTTYTANGAVETTNLQLSIDEIPHCVNVSLNANWGGAVNPSGCSNAMALLRRAIGAYFSPPFTFFSKAAYPYMPPTGGWGLPQGAVSG